MVTKAKKACNLENSFDEVNLYIQNATEKFGKFEFAPARMQLDPKLEEEQIKILYPKVQAVNLIILEADEENNEPRASSCGLWSIDREDRLKNDLDQLKVTDH